MLRTQICKILWHRRLAADICARVIFILIIFSVLMSDSISTWYNVDDTKAAEKIKRDMILDRVTLKQGKTRCRRELITRLLFRHLFNRPTHGALKNA